MNTRLLLRTALFAALTALGAFVRIPFALSAVTLQFLFTAMAGVLLGAKYGALSQLLYLALGLVGMPIFTLGGGFGYVLQPTFGFLAALPAAAAIIGAMTARRADAARIALACVCALAALYAIGLSYMALILNGYLAYGMNAWQIAMAGMLPFLPGDAAKIAVCALLCPRLRRSLGSIRADM